MHAFMPEHLHTHTHTHTQSEFITSTPCLFKFQHTLQALHAEALHFATLQFVMEPKQKLLVQVLVK